MSTRDARLATPPRTRRARCLGMLIELSDYLDGELSPARCRAIVRHLDQCPCCEHFADGLRRAIVACRQSGVKRLPADVRRRAHARIVVLLGSPPAAGRRPQTRHV